VQKTNSDIKQVLSCIQEKYSKIGAKVFYADGYSGKSNPKSDVLRALSLLKLSGSAVFISESKSQAEELTGQLLSYLFKHTPGYQVVQLDIGALIAADKEYAEVNLKNIIHDLAALSGGLMLFVTALEKAAKEKSVISVFRESLAQKSVQILSVVNMKEFHALDKIPELSGFLQFVLAGKNNIRAKRNKSVLIIGASSLFGNAVYRYFSREYETVTGTGFSKASSLGFEKLDVTLEEEIKTYFAKHSAFDIVIYVAGEANADVAEKERNRAHALNVDAISSIARHVKKCKFVYISSEYIFDGKKGPYGSSSKVQPINYYGCTKLEGEAASLKNFPDGLIIRLGALYGYNGPYDKETTVSKLIKSFNKPEPLKADNIQIKHPVLLEDAAATLLKLLDYGVSGVYQVNGPEGLNKQEMAEKIAAVRNKIIGEIFAYPIIGIEQPGVAAKPLNTHMVNVDTPRPFEEGIVYMLNQQQV